VLQWLGLGWIGNQKGASKAQAITKCKTPHYFTRKD
jgi:hypothetical protein